jgi:hypothetical protein
MLESRTTRRTLVRGVFAERIMDSTSDRGRAGAAERFAREADGAGASLGYELWQLICQNRKWWMLPVIGVLMMVGLLVLMGGTAAAPFIYTLF